MHVDLRVLVLAALVGALGAVASLSQIGFALEEDVGLSWLFRLRGSRPAPDEAVVVRFDRNSLARLRDLPTSQDAWPEPLKGCGARFGGLEVLDEATSLDRMPRALYACLVEELAQRGAAVIAFDLVFRRDPRREQGVAALAATLRAHGRVVLLEKAVRVWLPSAPGQTLAGDAVQADLLEGPHPALKAAAIATAPFLLPRGTAQVHQFWAFNPALATPTQLPMRALEALALPALERLAGSTGELGPPSDLVPAEVLRRHIDWLHAYRGRLGWLPEQGQHADRGGWSEQEMRLLHALDQAYGGPDGYYLNFYGPPGTFPTISAADLLAPDDPGPKGLAPPDLRGRVVFVGYQELDIPQASDSFPTAFQSRHGVDLSGVEIAATAFANLLHGETWSACPNGRARSWCWCLAARSRWRAAWARCGEGWWRRSRLPPLTALWSSPALWAGSCGCRWLSRSWASCRLPSALALPFTIGVPHAGSTSTCPARSAGICSRAANLLPPGRSAAR